MRVGFLFFFGSTCALFWLPFSCKKCSIQGGYPLKGALLSRSALFFAPLTHALLCAPSPPALFSLAPFFPSPFLLVRVGARLFPFSLSALRAPHFVSGIRFSGRYWIFLPFFCRGVPSFRHFSLLGRGVGTRQYIKKTSSLMLVSPVAVFTRVAGFFNRFPLLTTPLPLTPPTPQSPLLFLSLLSFFNCFSLFLYFRSLLRLPVAGLFLSRLGCHLLPFVIN